MDLVSFCTQLVYQHI